MKDKHAPQIKDMQSIRATGGSRIPAYSILATVYAFILECREKTSIGVTDGHEDGEA